MEAPLCVRPRIQARPGKVCTRKGDGNVGCAAPQPPYVPQYQTLLFHDGVPQLS